ncbi:hypothetical protein SERLA73DRAFT_179542, partial [Serpula lacrymans var. lacrymans S7.3]
MKDKFEGHYLEALDDHAQRYQDWEDARKALNALLSSILSGPIHQLHTNVSRARNRVNTTYTALQTAEKQTSNLEVSLNIEKRWEIGGSEYNCRKERASFAKYRSALDALKRAVVMRLTELSKLSMSGTGYKLQQQISKGLQWHSE